MPRVAIPAHPAAAPAYLAWVAYPHDERRRDVMFRAGMFLLADASGIRRQDMPESLSSMKGGPARMAEKLNAGLEIIWRKRVAAAYMFLRMNFGESARSQPRAACTRVAGAARKWFEIAQQSDLKLSNEGWGNAQGRVFRDSLPVLPMALGMMFTKATLNELWKRLAGGAPGLPVKLDGPLTLNPVELISGGWVHDAILAASSFPAPPLDFYLVP